MPFKKITLDNGLRIILVPKQDSLATTVLVLVEAGSKYETREINGLSHFLEHMCFKGTERRPKAIDISSELDSIGASYNAFTSHEYTGYFAKSEPKQFEKILDVVSDIYQNQIFDPAEIEKEKGVIIEEMNMIQDTPMRHISDLWLHLLYGDQPAGWDIIGRKEVIQKLSHDDFLQYTSEHYLASSTIIVVAGKLNEEKAVPSIKESFRNIKNNKKTPKIKIVEEQSKPAILIKTKETDQTHLVMGTRAFDIFDKRKYALEVLEDILGGSTSSRLFQRVREEMGAAYYIWAGSDLFSDHGYLSVQAGVPKERAGEVVKAILEEMEKIKKEPVSEKDLERAKEHIIGTTMLGLETSNALAGFYGDQEVLLRNMITPDELSVRIRAVKSEEIMSLANDIFVSPKLNLAVIGPLKDKEEFEKILTLS